MSNQEEAQKKINNFNRKAGKLKADVKRLESFFYLLVEKETGTNNNFKNTSLFFETLYNYDKNLFNRIKSHLKTSRNIYCLSGYIDTFEKYIDLFKTIYKLNLNDMILL
jgi:hypothetical protein